MLMIIQEFNFFLLQTQILAVSEWWLQLQKIGAIFDPFSVFPRPKQAVNFRQGLPQETLFHGLL